MRTSIERSKFDVTIKQLQLHKIGILVIVEPDIDDLSF